MYLIPVKLLTTCNYIDVCEVYTNAELLINLLMSIFFPLGGSILLNTMDIVPYIGREEREENTSYFLMLVPLKY